MLLVLLTTEPDLASCDFFSLLFEQHPLSLWAPYFLGQAKGNVARLFRPAVRGTQLLGRGVWWSDGRAQRFRKFSAQPRAAASVGEGMGLEILCGLRFTALCLGLIFHVG